MYTLTAFCGPFSVLVCCVGAIEQPEVEFDDPNLRNLVKEVSLKEVRVFNPGMDVSIIAFDCGMKANIIRCVYCARCEISQRCLSDSVMCKSPSLVALARGQVGRVL